MSQSLFKNLYFTNRCIFYKPLKVELMGIATDFPKRFDSDHLVLILFYFRFDSIRFYIDLVRDISASKTNFA